MSRKRWPESFSSIASCPSVSFLPPTSSCPLQLYRVPTQIVLPSVPFLECFHQLCATLRRDFCPTGFGVAVGDREKFPTARKRLLLLAGLRDQDTRRTRVVRELGADRTPPAGVGAGLRGCERERTAGATVPRLLPSQPHRLPQPRLDQGARPPQRHATHATTTLRPRPEPKPKPRPSSFPTISRIFHSQCQHPDPLPQQLLQHFALCQRDSSRCTLPHHLRQTQRTRTISRQSRQRRHCILDSLTCIGSLTIVISTYL